MAVEYKHLATNETIYGLVWTNELTFAQSVVRVMLGVIERFDIHPSLYNSYRHDAFLQYCTIVCTWAHRMTVCSGGNDNPFHLIRTYLEELNKRVNIDLVAVDRRSEDLQQNILLQSTIFNAWVLFEIHVQCEHIAHMLQEPP